MNEEILKKAIEGEGRTLRGWEITQTTIAQKDKHLIQEYIELCKTKIEAMEKQIAKEPVGKGVFKYCANCNSIVNEEYSADWASLGLTTYCKDCGQKVRCEDE